MAITQSDGGLASLVHTLTSELLPSRPYVALVCLPSRAWPLWGLRDLEDTRPILLDILKPLREEGRLYQLLRFDCDFDVGPGSTSLVEF